VTTAGRDDAADAGATLWLVPLTRRRNLRGTAETVERAAALRALVLLAAGEAPPAGDRRLSPHEAALAARPPSDWDEQDTVDALWRGEALGTLAWALSLVESMPAYDTPFDHLELARGLDVAAAELRRVDELQRARATARLWHWRARTALLQQEGSLALPERWRSLDQLVAAAAMRGHEEGHLPPPARGDFAAFGTTYRRLGDEQRALAWSIASERHHALEWLCGSTAWDDTPTDT
jgi:hypothetical protein